MQADTYWTEHPMSSAELREVDPRRTMPADILRPLGILDTLHAEALEEAPADAAVSIWDGVKPGTVISWYPIGGKQMRRVLVEGVDEPIRPETRLRMVWGVEVTRSYGLRGRRGVKASKRRPFYISEMEINQTGITGERITDTIQFVEHLRSLSAH